MSETSPNLRLPYIMPAQAQKHVTHNEAIRALDAVVQLCVAGRSLSAPPASPPDGLRHIVAAAATGAWAGKSGSIAAFQDGAWAFHAPGAGWLAWVQDEDRLCVFDGAAWVDAVDVGPALNPAALVGVNATADTTNRLSVSSPASLFNHAGSDHRQRINKAAPADTASQVYQSGFSGRAELGLTGDDDFHLKVSADGSTWKDAIVVDRASAVVSFPFSSFATGLANPWAGSKWAALGTSITSEGFYTDRLEELLEAELTNLGVSGGHLSVPSEGSGGEEIYDQIAEIPEDADLVTLEVSINDFGRASPLGSIGDTTTATFYGALLAAGVDILADNVERTLVYITPYAYSSAGAYPEGANWNTPNANGDTLAQFQQAVRDVGRMLGCPIIDMAESGISAQTAALYLSDGLHLNASGGERFAQFAFGKLGGLLPATPQVATPTFSPAPGTYGSTQSVTIACATSGSTIHYTTDGSTPTTSSPVYSSAISVPATTTIKALAVKAGLTNSAVATGAFAIGSAFGNVASIPFVSTQNFMALTVVNRLAAASLTIPSGTVTQIQVEAQGTVRNVYVGQAAASGDAYDAASLTQVTFGGAPGVVAATGVKTLSDTVAFTWDKTSDLVICADWQDSDTSDYVHATGPAWATLYYKAGQDAGTVDKSGYATLGSGSMYCITRVRMDGF